MARKGNPNIASVDRTPKPELRVGSNVSQCPTCDLYFTGVRPFDMHLIGADTGHPHCMTPAQMRASGMVENKYGVWQSGTRWRKKSDSAA